MGKLFNDCFEFTVGLESGYYNNPNDRGGPTKYGVAFNYNKEHLNSLGYLDPTSIRDLTLDEAKEIYKVKYWVPSKCHILSEFPLLTKYYFDHVIHGGVRGAGRVLQRTINILLPGIDDDLIVDGRVGPSTLNMLDELIEDGYDPDVEFNDRNFAYLFNVQRALNYLEMYNDEGNKSWYGNKRFLQSGIRRLPMRDIL